MTQYGSKKKKIPQAVARSKLTESSYKPKNSSCTVCASIDNS